MLNAIQLMGRLAQSPQLFVTQSNHTICRFSLAVRRDYKGQDGEYATDFFNIIAWNKFAEFITEHFTKGQLVTLSGSLRTRAYTDKNGNNRIATEIIAEHIYFTGRKPEDKQDGVSAASSGLADTSEYAELVDQLNSIADDDYPF